MTPDQQSASAAFKTRYKRAEQYRDSAEDELSEALMHISPGREDDFSDTNPENRDDDREVFTSLAEDLATDFATDLIDYYCPSEQAWAEYEVTAPVPQDAADIVKKLVTEREQAIHEMIEASNFNDVAPQVFFEGAHGTIGMWQDVAHITQSFYCEPVLPNELLVTPGHMGILDRFREKRVLATEISTLFASWPNIDLESDDNLKELLKKEGMYLPVCYGFWVDWSDPGQPQWMCEVTINNKTVCLDKKPFVIGPLAGGCPLHVARVNPKSHNPWGKGPARKVLPDMRVHKYLDGKTMEGIDQALDNTVIYPNDGVLDMQDGLQTGKAYAAHRDFNKNKVWEMNRGVNLDMGLYSMESIEERMREGFYQDGPRQRGDTPPTAAQWLDQRRRVQKRMGKPTAPIWTELLLPFIQRTELIGVMLGRFDGPLTHDGNVISIQPRSPQKKAANHDKVMVARSNLELGVAAFPEDLPNVVDMVGTFKNIVDESGDRITVIRDEERAPPDATTPPPQ